MTETPLHRVGELHRRDTALAAEIEAVARLAEQAGGIRARGAEVEDALRTIPGERAALDALDAAASGRLRRAEEALSEAEAALAAAERALRGREERRAEALADLRVARESLADAQARRRRHAERRARIGEEEAALQGESAALLAAARALADELEAMKRVADAAKGDPGTTLAGLDAWGGSARAALFVVRGTLETERERIAVEANALAAAVLGEDLGGISVALVARRLERALGRGPSI